MNARSIRGDDAMRAAHWPKAAAECTDLSAIRWKIPVMAVCFVALVAWIFYFCAIADWHYTQGAALRTAEKLNYVMRTRAILERVSRIASDPLARFEDDGPPEHRTWRYVSDVQGSITSAAGAIEHTYSGEDPTNVMGRLMGLAPNTDKQVWTKLRRGPEGAVIAFSGNQECNDITSWLSPYTLARARGAWAPGASSDRDQTDAPGLKWSEPGGVERACLDWYGAPDAFLIHFDPLPTR